VERCVPLDAIEVGPSCSRQKNMGGEKGAEKKERKRAATDRSLPTISARVGQDEGKKRRKGGVVGKE